MMKTCRKNNRFNESSILLTSLFLFLISGNGALAADEINPANLTAEKIFVSSDRLTANQNTQFVSFSGNVKAVRGTTTIFSDILNIYYNDPKDSTDGYGRDSIQKIIATGNVRIELEDKIANCEQAVYLTENQSLILTGKDTRIQSAGNFISGEKITIFQATGQVIVDGSENNRVNAVFQPEEKPLIPDFK